MKQLGVTWFLRNAFAVLLVATLIVAAMWHYSLFSRRNTIQKLQELPVGSQVRLVGVVTYIDEPGGRFWMEDESGALPISVNPSAARIHLSETVEVRAVKATPYDRNRGPISDLLRDVRVSASSTEVKLPQSIPVTLPNLLPPEKNGILIQTTVVVRSVTQDSFQRTVLVISDSPSQLSVVVGERGGDYSKLVNAQVRIIGLSEQSRNHQGWLMSTQLWVNSGHDIYVEQAAPDPSRLYTIRALYRENGSWNGHKIRVRGIASKVTSNSILLEDRWAAIECHLDGPSPIKAGTSVEVDGFPEQDAVALNLFHSKLTAIPAGEIEGATEAELKLPVLNSVAEIRGLKPSQAAEALPARITGVITYIDPLWRQLWLQDESGGIFIKYPGDQPELHVARRVTVTGITNAGNYAPVIAAPKFRVEGEGALPKPVSVTTELAASGQREGLYVEIEGVVHLIRIGDNPGHPVLVFELYSEIGQVHVVTTPMFSDLKQAQFLEDAKVRMRGVFSVVFNSRRQLVGYQMIVAAPSDIKVIEPAAPNPFDMKPIPIQSLLTYSTDSKLGHRVRVEGAVTLVEPSFLFLQDASGGVELRGDAQSIQIGDHVEALGYPTFVGHDSPVMMDAVFRLKEPASPIAAKSTTVESIVNGHEDSILVTIEGKLLMALDGPGRKSLVMQSGVRTFTAQLNTTDVGSALWQLREGSVLRLTGVCSTQINPDEVYRLLQENSSDFQLLLRSPQDLQVIKSPPFWTVQRTFVLMGALTILFVVAQYLLHRLQQWRLRSVLQEREQLAFEMHDTLAQCFTGIAYQLQAASHEKRGEDQVQAHIQNALKMVHLSHREASRTISSLRPQYRDAAAIVSSLKATAERLSDGGGLQIDASMKGRNSTLTLPVTDAFSRIGQEAISNAIQHSQCRTLTILLNVSRREACLTIRDDGRGFVTNQTQKGLGIEGMRNHAMKAKAELEVRSTPGEGTTVSVRAARFTASDLLRGIHGILRFYKES